MSVTNNNYKAVDRGIDPYQIPLSQDLADEKLRDLPCFISAIWNTVFCCCMPFTCCFALKIVKPMKHTVVSECGIPTYILRQPGPHCIGVCCTETEDVEMGLDTKEIRHMAAADDHGSPIVVTAQYVYRIQDPLAAMYRTRQRDRAAQLEKFIYEQGESALRSVVSMYPYDIDRKDSENVSTRKLIDDDEDNSPHPLTSPCLAKHSTAIDNQLVQVFQAMVSFAGIKIETFRLISVGYPEKMEKLLLARQEAQAQVTARKTIAEGTTGIIAETISRLKALGIELSDQDKNHFAQTLTLVMVNHGHTTINIFDGGQTSSTSK